MRTITELLEGHDKVWFLIGGDKEFRATFMSQAIRVGLRFGNGKPLSPDGCGNCIAVDREGRLTYLSYLAWEISFREDAPDRFINLGDQINNILKVDYKACLQGDEAFVYGSDRKLITLEDYQQKQQ